MPSETDVQILITSANESAEGLSGAKEGLKGLGAEAEKTGAQGTKSALEHGKAMKRLGEDFKTANIETMMMAQMVGNLGGKFKELAASMAAASTIKLQDEYKALGKEANENTMKIMEIQLAAANQHRELTEGEKKDIEGLQLANKNLQLEQMKTKNKIDDQSKSIDQWSETVENLKAKFGELPGPVQSAIVTTTSFVGSLASMASTYGQLAITIGKTLTAHGIELGAISAKTIVNKAHAVSQWLVNASMYGCPLVWIVAAIIAVIVVVVLLIKYWKEISKAFGDFGDWAQKGLGDAGKAAGDWAGKTGAAIGDAGAGLKKWQDNNAKAMKDFAGGIGDSIKGAWDKVTGWLKNLWGEISGAFSKIISGALDWGKDLLRKFIEGMLEGIRKIPYVGNMIADKLKDWLGFSGPPPEGALHHVPVWGEHMVESYAKGMRAGMPALESSLRLTMDSQLRNLGRAQAAVSTYHSTQYQRNASQQNNIYISNADPDKIAARVLQLLEEALR